MKHVRLGMAFTLVALSAGCGDSSGSGGAGGAGPTSTASGTTHATTTSGSTTATSTSASTSGTTTAASASASTTASSSNTSTSVASSSSTGGNPNITEVPCNGATLSATVVTTPSFLFSPEMSTIPIGGIVEFAPGIEHAVVADDNSFFVDGGDVKCFAYSAAGTYPFHCAIHTFMTGSITAQ